MYEQLKHTTVNGTPIVKKEAIILDIPTKPDTTFFLLTPAFWLGLLLLVVSYSTYSDWKGNARTKWIDTLLFSLTGIAGFIILFLWFLTDHDATKANYNIFWAFAPNLIIAFYLVKNRPVKWLITYIRIALVLLVISVVLWLLKVQVFSVLISFILLALGIRYLFLIDHLKKTV